MDIVNVPTDMKELGWFIAFYHRANPIGQERYYEMEAGYIISELKKRWLGCLVFSQTRLQSAPVP